MKGELKAVLIDLDGTLTRFNLDYLGARRRALEEMKKLGVYNNSFSEEMSVYFMMKKLAGRIDVDRLEALRNRLYRILEEAEVEASEGAALLPNAVEVLLKLKRNGLKLGLVTNNGRKGTMRTLEKLGLKSFFDAIVTRDDCSELKPDGGSVVEALKLLEILSQEAVFVGDSVIDILAAKKAGVRSVAVPSGPFTLERLLKVQPDYLINSIIELPELIEILNGS